MIFDRSRLTIKSAVDRKSRVYLKDAKEGIEGVPAFASPEMDRVVEWLKTRKGPAIWFLGGHVFKANVAWYVKQVRKKWIQHLATNGAGLIHDWELCSIGHTSEDVAEAIKDGSFGMWEGIGQINEFVASYSQEGVSAATSRDSSYSEISTIHPACGQDVFCMHPNYDAKAWGEASYIDFLKFASAVENMQGGTFLVFGSAVCAPEIFLKALSMARNVNAGKPDDIAIAVFDCVKLPANLEDRYFNRPAKTLLDRITPQSVFVHGRHEDTIPNLWKRLCT